MVCEGLKEGVVLRINQQRSKVSSLLFLLLWFPVCYTEVGAKADVDTEAQDPSTGVHVSIQCSHLQLVVCEHVYCILNLYYLFVPMSSPAGIYIHFTLMYHLPQMMVDIIIIG